MDLNKKHVLNKYHVLFLNQNIITGLGFLTLAYDISEVSYAIWTIPFFLGIFVSIMLYVMIKLLSLFPNDNLYTINEKLLGKPIGKILNLCIILYGVIFVSMIIEGYAREIQTISLPNKTIFLPTLFLCIATIVIVRGGIKSIARYCILSFFMTIWLTYFLRWSFMNATWSHLFPLLNFTSKDFFSALKDGFLTILGFESILFYYPFIVQKEKAFKHSLYGLWLASFIFSLACLASAVTFTDWQLKNVRTPILSLFQAVELSFIERIENLGLNMWIFLILSTTSMYLWISSKGIASFTKKDHTWYIYLIGLISLLIIFLPIKYEYKDMISETSIKFGFFLCLLPILLLVIYKLKLIWRKTNE